MKRLLKKILLGITLKQEYICVALEELNNRMKLFLQSGNNALIDVTEDHILLGYKPLLIGLTNRAFPENFLSGKHNTKILHIGINETEITAKLWMETIYNEKLGNHSILILKGIKGRDHFTNSVQQLIQNFYYTLTAEK